MCVPVHTVSMAMADGPPLHLHLHDGDSDVSLWREMGGTERPPGPPPTATASLQLAKGLAPAASKCKWLAAVQHLFGKGKEMKGKKRLWCGVAGRRAFASFGWPPLRPSPPLPATIRTGRGFTPGALPTLGNSTEDPCLPDRVSRVRSMKRERERRERGRALAPLAVAVADRVRGWETYGRQTKDIFTCTFFF